MVYLPTFGWLLGQMLQMLVNIPYMEHMGMIICSDMMNEFIIFPNWDPIGPPTYGHDGNWNIIWFSGNHQEPGRFLREFIANNGWSRGSIQVRSEDLPSPRPGYQIRWAYRAYPTPESHQICPNLQKKWQALSRKMNVKCSRGHTSNVLQLSTI